MQKFNYHTHTYRCGHADKDLTDEDYVKEFINKGFTKIAFTDHIPQKEIIDKRSNMRMDYSQLSEYLESIKLLKEKYEKEIEIQTGFEFEYLPGQEENLFELKNKVDKFVLGQHFIYDENQNDLKIFRRDKFNDEELIRYANYIKKAIELNLVDIVVHPDLYMLARDYFGDVERQVAIIICETAEKYDIPLEINLTEASMFLSNLLTKIKYPCKDFWNIVSNYNIRVIYGVDAHYKSNIHNCDKSTQLVNEIIGKEIVKKLKFCKYL